MLKILQIFLYPFHWKHQILVVFPVYPLPVVPARGGAEVALRLYCYTMTIRPFSSIELAYATANQPGPCVRACFVRQWCTVPKVALTLHTPHFISSHLLWALLTSSQLFSPHLISSHMSSKFFSTTLISSEHCSAFCISSKLFSTHLSSSARQKAFTVREKSLAHKNRSAQKAFAQRRFATQKLETQMRLPPAAATLSEKNTMVRARASSPRQVSCNIHAAITMRFATSLGNPHVSMHMANTTWQHSCSHSTAICNQRFNKRIELRRHEQPQSAEHSGGTNHMPKRPQRHLPFIAGCGHFTRKNTMFRAPASSQKHVVP